MYFVKDEDSMKMHHQNLQQFLEHGTFKEVNVQAKVIGPWYIHSIVFDNFATHCVSIFFAIVCYDFVYSKQ